jgi:hypothetical protein
MNRVHMTFEFQDEHNARALETWALGHNLEVTRWRTRTTVTIERGGTVESFTVRLSDFIEQAVTRYCASMVRTQPLTGFAYSTLEP